MRAMSRKSFRVKKTRGKPQKSLTVGGLFQQSLKQLMERIFAASPHFVRCIKPNYEKKPKLCDDTFMLTQLTYVVNIFKRLWLVHFQEFIICYQRFGPKALVQILCTSF